MRAHCLCSNTKQIQITNYVFVIDPRELYESSASAFPVILGQCPRAPLGVNYLVSGFNLRHKPGVMCPLLWLLAASRLHCFLIILGQRLRSAHVLALRMFMGPDTVSSGRERESEWVSSWGCCLLLAASHTYFRLRCSHKCA